MKTKQNNSVKTSSTTPLFIEVPVPSS